MSKHTFLDNMTVSSAALMFKKSKFFRDSIDSPSYSEHLEGISLIMPEIKGEGFYEVTAQSLAGELDPAFHVAQWKGNEYPTIIYHHGNNERPFDYGLTSKNTFKSILMVKKKEIPANLVSVRAPYHRSFKVYLKKIAHLSNFTAMLVVSVKLIEALRVHFSAGGSRVVVAGISLGGWIVNLHRAYYNTADAYVPMLAGAALEDVFTGSAYRRLVGTPAQKNPGAVMEVLNFEGDYAKIKDANVFPVLASHDQIIRFERQKQSYNDIPVTTLEKGHVTAVMAAAELRTHILHYLIPSQTRS